MPREVPGWAEAVARVDCLGSAVRLLQDIVNDLPDCPLCSGTPVPFHVDGERWFFRCARCSLVFLHPGQRLTPLHEVLRYCEHRNSADDEGYVQFLSRLADPVRARLTEGARGLDYGCGPAPVLAAIFTAAGYPTESYDPFFLGDEGVHGKTYDFVSCTEVLEHVYDPFSFLERLGSIVRSGGLIALMTRFYGVEARFPDWWYHRDPTHVCFYNQETMKWIADSFGWTLEIPTSNVAIFTT